MPGPAPIADAMLGIRATVIFLPTEESGRTVPVRREHRYRPHFDFEPWQTGREMGGEMRIEDRDACGPGEECTAAIMFEDAELLPVEPRAGLAFRVQEGRQVVARGTVLELIEWRLQDGQWVALPPLAT